MSRQSIDPLALIPTIGDDSDVPDLDGSDDDDDDEMVETVRIHKSAKTMKDKSMDFNEQFQFLMVEKKRCKNLNFVEHRFLVFRTIQMKSTYSNKMIIK